MQPVRRLAHAFTACARCWSDVSFKVPIWLWAAGTILVMLSLMRAYVLPANRAAVEPFAPLHRADTSSHADASARTARAAAARLYGRLSRADTSSCRRALAGTGGLGLADPDAACRSKRPTSDARHCLQKTFCSPSELVLRRELGYHHIISLKLSTLAILHPTHVWA